MHEFGFKIYRVAPLRLRHFARGLNQKAKTDKLDAKVLALFGLKNELNPSMVPSETMNQLKETYVLMQKLVQLRTEMLLRWQSMQFSNTQNSCKGLTKHIDIEIAECENKILEIIKSDDNLWQQYRIIMSIKGVGKKCAMAMLALMPELGYCNDKEIASLAGLAPINRESGKWIGKSFISGEEKLSVRPYICLR